MPESDMQPSPIADTAMPEEPSTRVGSFSTLLMFCDLTEFLTPLALASYHIATEKFAPVSGVRPALRNTAYARRATARMVLAAFGPQPSSIGRCPCQSMSALPPKADISQRDERLTIGVVKSGI